MTDSEAPRQGRDPEAGTATSTQQDRPQVQFVSPTGVLRARAEAGRQPSGPPVMEMRDVSVFYGDYEAVRGTTLPIARNQITAMIGPSGCGKSTILRSLNRMNDLIPGARVRGTVTYQGQDIYAPEVDPIQVRRRVGMVFQKPNPFPKSIYDNVAYGLRINGLKGKLHEQVEEALTGAALWEEVKDKLKTS